MAKLARGFCRRTSKKRYPDSIAAKMALSTIQAWGSESSEAKPTREYKCEFCNGYHLTSQAKNKKLAA